VYGSVRHVSEMTLCVTDFLVWPSRICMQLLCAALRVHARYGLWLWRSACSRAPSRWLVLSACPAGGFWPRATAAWPAARRRRRSAERVRPCMRDGAARVPRASRACMRLALLLPCCARVGVACTRTRTRTRTRTSPSGG
jgi:hypothetical protein